MTAPDTAAIRAQMEALSGFAPGPWKVSPTDDTTVITHDRNMVAEIDGDYNEPDLWPIMEANARLIAAAPDMNATILALCDALDAAQTSACPRGEDCDMTLAYMVGRGRKDDDMAVLRAENERLRNFIADFSETKFDRIDRRAPDPQDDLDPLTDYLAIEAWQEDARATSRRRGASDVRDMHCPSE